jgi:hypothetical protein
MDIFNQVFTLKNANEIWLKLHELHEGTSNVREQKHCLVLNEYNSFAMKDNEIVSYMYSRLNLIVNDRKGNRDCRGGNSPAGWRSAPALNPKIRKGLKRFACPAKRTSST